LECRRPARERGHRRARRARSERHPRAGARPLPRRARDRDRHVGRFVPLRRGDRRRRSSLRRHCRDHRAAHGKRPLGIVPRRLDARGCIRIAGHWRRGRERPLVGLCDRLGASNGNVLPQQLGTGHSAHTPRGGTGSDRGAVEQTPRRGRGIFGTRPGPATAGAGLRGAFGLAWRLNRAGVLGWAIALFIFGLAYGPVLSEADSFLKDLPIMAEFLPDLDAGGAELFGSLVIAIAAILCAVPTTQVILRLRAEEAAGRAGPVLATPVSRPGWALRSAALAVLTAALTLTLFGLGMGLGAGLSMSQMSWVGNSLVASLNYLPAILVVAGLALFFVGFFPRAAGAAWAAVVYAVFVMYFGGLLDL